MSATATRIALDSLAAKLTDPQDRKTYAGLICYFDSIPKQDELFKMVELLGLLSLLGQRVPDTLAEYLKELRGLPTTAGEYYGQIDARLANLPASIAEGVDIAKLAKDMAEAFWQQLAATGLETSAAHLRNSSTEITALTAKLKPVTQEYEALADSIADGISKLTAASAELQRRTVQPVAKDRPRAWLPNGLFALVMFVLGGLCELLFAKGL